MRARRMTGRQRRACREHNSADGPVTGFSVRKWGLRTKNATIFVRGLWNAQTVGFGILVSVNFSAHRTIFQLIGTILSKSCGDPGSGQSQESTRNRCPGRAADAFAMNVLIRQRRPGDDHHLPDFSRRDEHPGDPYSPRCPLRGLGRAIPANETIVKSSAVERFLQLPSTPGPLELYGSRHSRQREDRGHEAGTLLLSASATLFLALAAHPRTGSLAMRRRDADDGGRGGSSGGSGSGSSWWIRRGGTSKWNRNPRCLSRAADNMETVLFWVGLRGFRADLQA